MSRRASVRAAYEVESRALAGGCSDVRGMTRLYLRTTLRRASDDGHEMPVFRCEGCLARPAKGEGEMCASAPFSRYHVANGVGVTDWH